MDKLELSVSINTEFDKFLFSFKIFSNSQQSTKGTEKMKDRSYDNKKKQIRICVYKMYQLYQLYLLYPIY